MRRGGLAAGPGRLDEGRATAQRDAVRQRDCRLQVPKEQEPAHGQADLLGILRDARRQVEGDVILAGGVVGFQAATTVHVGIDRYLDGFAASTLPADQVDDGLAALVADELGSFRCYFELCRHVTH